MEWQKVFDSNDEVARRTVLIAAGLSRHTIATNLRRGRWQEPLPGTVVAHSGPLSDRQRMRAALAYGGSTAVLSHSTAAGLLGLRVRSQGTEITVRHGLNLCTIGDVVVHQTRRPITPTFRDGLPCTKTARTVVDLALGMTEQADIRALVSDSVQRNLTDLASLYREVELMSRFRERVTRVQSVLDEVTGGVRSAGEAEMGDILRAAGLPPAELNVKLTLPDGRSAVVDALWRAERVIVLTPGV